MSLLTRWGGAPLFVAVLLVYLLSLPVLSYDSYWTVPTALMILHHGSTVIDEFVPGSPVEARYSLDCVPALGPGHSYAAGHECPGGHWYNLYPEGVPVVALPIVALLDVATRLTAALRLRSSHPVIAAFLAGDLARGRAITELVCGAIFCAITAWLMYRIAERFLSRTQSALIMLLCAFGTAQWSIASRSLMQHGPSALFLALALYLAVSARDQPARVALLSLPLATAFAVRPSNFISVAVFSIYVALHHSRWFLRFVGWSLPVAVPFLVYNLLVRHSLFPTYYNYGSAERSPALTDLTMNLVSPSRGLLIFTPVVLFSAAGMVLAWRSRWCFPLTSYLVAIAIAHSLLIALYWPGHGYGPRYYSDLSPLFAFFWIPAVLSWQKSQGKLRTASACLFVALAAWSIFVHARGATSTAANLWSASPVNVDDARWRVWDWRDPQFLRGL